MTIPFKDTPHRLFKNTFLQNVFAGIGFKTNETVSEGMRKEAHSFINQQFGLEAKSNFPEDAMSITSSDGMISFFFDKDSASVRIGARNYHSFVDNVIPQITKLDKYAGIMKADIVSCIGLRKINIWPILADNPDELKESEITKELFSSELLSEKSAQLNDKEKGIPLLGKYEWKDNALTITVRTAFMKDDSDVKKRNVVLDIEAMLEGPMAKEAAASQFNVLNDILFNAYNWCISPNVIRIMEGTK